MHASFVVQALSGERGLGEGKLIQENAMNLTSKARSLRKNQNDVEQLVWKHLRNRALTCVNTYAAHGKRHDI